MLEATAAVGVDPLLAVASSSGAGNANSALKHSSSDGGAQGAPAAGKGGGGGGVSFAAFVEVCDGLGFTALPGDPDHDNAAELLAMQKEWLSRQMQIAGQFAALRAHVLKVGWQHAAEYPSAALLTRARELMADCSRAMGALARAATGASQAEVQAALEELLRTLERGGVAIAIEEAGTEEAVEAAEAAEFSAPSSFSTI